MPRPAFDGVDQNDRVEGSGQAAAREVGATSRRFWQLLLLIVLAGIGLRVGYVLTVTQFDHGFYDAAFYENEARSVADGHAFVYPLLAPQANHPAADHPPLTVLALVPAATLPGNSTSRLWMRFTMVAFGALVVVLVGLLARSLAGARAGLVAAALGAVYANFWMNDGLLMSETLATLTTVAALVLAYRYLRRPTWQCGAAIGVACGLAMLARAELILLIPFLALPVAWVSHRRSEARLAALGVVLTGAVVVAGPWVGFNLARFKEPTFISTGDGYALLGANCSSAYNASLVGLWDLACFPTTPPHGDESQVNLAYRNQATSYMRSHVSELPIQVLARFGRLLGVYDPGLVARYNAHEGRPRWASYLGMASFLLLLPFAVGGFIWLRRRRVRVWPLLAPVYVVLISGAVFYGTPRFRAPAEPVVVVLAAVAALALLGRWRPGWAPETPGVRAARGRAQPTETSAQALVAASPAGPPA